ncbi:hypothetical protein GCM10011309_20400 [Litorimonas cladophorae]|uniref:Uncharacterized protein n=1 Tax=Litorimonas cladophorae TaxID=1220491 RepID=A0A918NIM2_9PROT|nr:hypothetical protein GCM10011309_20400 [Litorimonas cladophorae]
MGPSLTETTDGVSTVVFATATSGALDGEQPDTLPTMASSTTLKKRFDLMRTT